MSANEPPKPRHADSAYRRGEDRRLIPAHHGRREVHTSRCKASKIFKNLDGGEVFTVRFLIISTQCDNIACFAKDSATSVETLRQIMGLRVEFQRGPPITFGLWARIGKKEIVEAEIYMYRCKQDMRW